MEEVVRKKGVTLWEFVSTMIAVFTAALIFWKNTDVRLTSLELRISAQERQSEKVFEKLDRIEQGINTININLQNKEDKK